ncbi:MAG TPA: TetR family transcriptional regulator [Burkholderiaceae bacterium]|nr:TetR family transcriptional regulator [Burkholderiaceae bacterium]
MALPARPSEPRSRANVGKAGAHAPGFDHLLDTAATQFARFGLDGASLRDIGRDAGIGAPLICYHFETKQQLYLEAFEHKAEQTIDLISDQVARCQDPTLRVRTLVQALYDLLMSERELTALLQRDIIDATLCERTLLSRRVYKHFIALIRDVASAFTGRQISERTAFSIMSLILGYSLMTNVRVLADLENRPEAMQADRAAVADEALKLLGQTGPSPDLVRP